MNSPDGCRPWIRLKSVRACRVWSPPFASTKAPSCAGAILLFQIDPRPFQAEVDRLRAELARTRATGQRAASELQTAEKLRAENAIAKEEHDRRAAFAQESTAQSAAVEAALRAAELNLEFTQVTSPIDGRVGRAIVTEGNLVSSGPGEATLLTTVVSLDPVYAYFDADEQIFLKYTRQRPVQRRPAKGSALRAAGPVQSCRFAWRWPTTRASLAPVIWTFSTTSSMAPPARFAGERSSGTPTVSSRPGLFVRLRLAGTASYRGLLIQDRAVGTDLSKKFVYVVGPKNEIQYRSVTLGPIVDGLRVVRSGLEAGESVVVNGLQRVRPGVQVTPVVEATDHSS